MKRSIKKDLWNRSKEQVKGNATGSTDLNDYLNVVRNRIYTIQRDLVDKNIPVTAVDIKNIYWGNSHENKGILVIFKDHNNKCEELIGIDYASGTVERYKTCYMHLESFIMRKYNRADIPLKQINHAFISDLEHYLKTVRMCAHNTTVKYLRNFRKIIRIALSNDWIKTDPFRHIKLRTEEVQIESLSKEELEKIAGKKISIERVERVRDIFLFCCYTGLAYSDVKDLSKNHLEIDEKGMEWIKKRRKKTNQVSEIPLRPAAKEILKKYENDPLCQSRDLLLPVASNQRYNLYLKEVADISGIKKKLTTHTARHTFATLMLSEGFTMEAVSKMLGHSSINMTKKYAQITRDYLRRQAIRILPGEFKVYGVNDDYPFGNSKKRSELSKFSLN